MVQNFSLMSSVNVSKHKACRILVLQNRYCVNELTVMDFLALCVLPIGSNVLGNHSLLLSIPIY
jgi:hypothetical protein